MGNLKSRRSFYFQIETLEIRRLLVGDIQQPVFSPGFSQSLTSPAHETLTFSVLPQTADPNYAGGSPTGTVTVGWWGGPVLGSAAASSSPVTIPLTLDQNNAGTKVSFGNYIGDHVLYVNYEDSGNFASTVFTENDFLSFEGRGVPGYGVSFNAPAGNRLAVTRQPVNTPVGDSLSPPVNVSLLNSTGAVDTSTLTTVSVALSSTSTGIGSLNGTTTVQTVSGVATFSNLSINKPGQYALTFTDGAGDSISSNPFHITGGKLVFIQPPHDGTAGEALSPAVVVALEDSHHHIITSDSTSVVTLTPIGLAANPLISGNVVQLVNGKATFSDLILTKPDFYKLVPDDGGDAVVPSPRFKIAGDHLVFTRQPVDSDVNSPLVLTVGLFNSRNRLDTNATTTIGLSLNTVSSGGSPQLQGTVSTQFVAGKAFFTAVAGPIVTAGGMFTLTATEEELTNGFLVPVNTTSSINSRKFKISGYHLVFIKQPAPTISVSDDRYGFWVALLDSRNRLDTSDTTHGVSLVITLPTDRFTAREPVTFTDLGFHGGIDKIQVAPPSVSGDYKLRANEADAHGNLIAETTLGISRVFRAQPISVFFFHQPAPTIDYNQTVSFNVGIKDFRNDLVTTGPYGLSVAYQRLAVDVLSLRVVWTDELNGSMSGTNDRNGFVNGRAEYDQFNVGSLTIAGTKIRLRVNAATPFSCQTGFSKVIMIPFNIRGR